MVNHETPMQVQTKYRLSLIICKVDYFAAFVYL